MLGGSAAWQGVASETLSSSGATDARSGIDHHEYRVSTGGGTRFRTVDGIGLASAWAPAAPGASNTACIS